MNNKESHQLLLMNHERASSPIKRIVPQSTGYHQNKPIIGITPMPG